MIPIIATRNTDEIQEAIHTGRPLLGSSPIDPTVYENMGATAAKAKYLLAFQTRGSIEADQVAAESATGCSLTETDIRMVMNAFYEVLADFVGEFGAVRMFTPLGVVETMVKGSVEDATDAIDPEENYAYLNLTPCDKLKEAVKALTFFNASEKTAPYKADTVVQHETGAEDPFPMGSDVDIRGRGFIAGGASVKFVDKATGSEAQATIVDNTQGNVIVVTVPTGLNIEHKQKIIVSQTVDGVDYDISTNKAVEVAPALLPDHEIGLVKHGSRADDCFAFDEGQTPVVVNVTHNNGATHLLRDETPKVWITIDFMDGSRHKVGTLDGLYDITVAEDTITFKMTDNTTELIDGDWWNRDATLYIGWADGTVSEKTIHCLQM